MYKRIKGKKFSRKTDQRRAFMRNLSVNLIMEEKITTTKTRARAASSMVERLITKAKAGNLAATRILSGILPQVAVKKLISNLAPRFAQRNGGYTRIIRIAQRFKDGAEMSVVEFIDRDEIAAKEKETKKEKTGGKKKSAKKAKPAKTEKKDEKSEPVEAKPAEK
jgi:large subunit ribosomal protein L17